MGAREHIKRALSIKGLTVKGLAERLDIPYQTMRNRLSRDKMTFDGVERIADAIDCEVVFVEKSEIKAKKKTIRKDKTY